MYLCTPQLRKGSLKNLQNKTFQTFMCLVLKKSLFLHPQSATSSLTHCKIMNFRQLDCLFEHKLRSEFFFKKKHKKVCSLNKRD
jgi:hypothetical protein